MDFNELALIKLVLGVILATLLAIVYSLRVLVLMERRVARMDLNIERMVHKIATEELKIEKTEEQILSELKKSKKQK
jgi:esterase/lipase